ncbi:MULTISPECIES: hypothetical protein [Legionella]|uniref:Uncharacterized protein n=1 Tax=Legionella septentrionalis TaxID=2498109 RepID=A0A3S0V9D4_9GAMM|nr:MULTISPECIES: hypothetical protein [Legionella]MCP0914275.1 hypothetical protein [Legionella sp. 27cVA30]RUQ79207.1 hypothetical protein EKM59_11295 [Legionella septentrionalis]RUR00608.1 hypothetical protein ELY11_02325 [Legionella septentrionalis]RUR11775.1 hypothetical protein ELY14_00595 [Legionella septentrionalis]RUR17463.1 hypothetical protein ELY10_00595 [Legionella septentrionalis]
MKRILLLSFFTCFSLTVNAADDPPNIADAENLDAKMCVDNTANDCVNTVCLNSEERDCIEQCQADAQAKCNVQADE